MMKNRDASEMHAQSFFQICDIARFSSNLHKTRRMWVVSERRIISRMNECAVAGLGNLRLNVEEIGGGSLQSSEKDYVARSASQIKSFG